MSRKKQMILLVCLILLISLLAPISQANAAGKFVKIGMDHLNIRKGPGLSYPIVAKAKKGERYLLLTEEKEWMEIQLPDGTKGWVADWLVIKENASDHNTRTSSPNTYAKVIADGLRVRKGPGTDFQVIGTIHRGQSLAIIGKDKNWIQLKTPYGPGWVSTDFIETGSKTGQTAKSVQTTGKITVNSLNVRSNPSQNAKIIGKLYRGNIVQVISQNSQWTEINYSGNQAWISSQYITAEQEQEKDKTANNNQQKHRPHTSISGRSGVVTASSLIVRKTASLNGSVIGSVSKGQSFPIIEEKGSFAKIEFKNGAFGWVAKWYLDISSSAASKKKVTAIKNSSAKILHHGTNIRAEANTMSRVIKRGNKGDVFEIIGFQNNWYQIRLSNGSSGFVAGWVVSINGSAPIAQKPGSANLQLKNKTIVIDPGHGGRDNGTTGARGTLEKNLTMKTAKLLYNKLKATGANVIMTRNTDTYIPLTSRVNASHYHNADAFISIHYDSNVNSRIRGMTTYYYHSYQKSLAANVHTSVTSRINIKDRGYRIGDYHVLRENKQNALLLELGFLSNPTEEALLNSGYFQENAALGIFRGLIRHFNRES